MIFAWNCLSLSLMAAQPLLRMRAVCAALVESPSYPEPICELYRVLWMVHSAAAFPAMPHDDPSAVPPEVREPLHGRP